MHRERCCDHAAIAVESFCADNQLACTLPCAIDQLSRTEQDSISQTAIARTSQITLSCFQIKLREILKGVHVPL